METRYRHRELDLIANEEVRERFIMRTKVVRAIRRWLDDRGFLEVETPVLQPLYGGALAAPFTTHHNALDRDLFLRIADELYLKRLIVGGLERVYEIGKDFRNEGVSHKHNPEFTMLEWYEAYADYNDIAARLEELISYVAEEVGYDGPVDFSTPWRRVTLRDAIREKTGVDVLAHRDRDELVAAAAERDIKLDPTATWGKLVDDLLSKHVEPGLDQPTFILDYPKELSPFAKDHRSEPGLVERFECFAAGMEFSNAFTELNDPDEQRARFEQQQRDEAAGDEETQPYDEDYVRALEQGMPPTGGIGVGIDRLVMILTGSTSVREVLLFPGNARLTRLDPPKLLVESGIKGAVNPKGQPKAVGRLAFQAGSLTRPSHTRWRRCRCRGKVDGAASGLVAPDKKRAAVFERFTERARQVVVLAQEEARILKHNYIGTEHILLGLLREEEGLAARVLESLDITVERVRAQVVRIVGIG